MACWLLRPEWLRAATGCIQGRSLADIPDQFDGTSFKLAAPDPNPKYGGVLRMGITNRVPHFDLHQSGTYNNLGSMGCMFDNLIRRDPRDGGKAVIPDLAHSWDIAKDRKTYTFFLRKGIQFHDGAELTSEDVKATFDRIVKPPQGISIPRSILFRAVSAVDAPDKYTVQFKLSEPRPPAFIMAAIASGWNVIVRKKTLEDNNYNLRKVWPYPARVHLPPYGASRTRSGWWRKTRTTGTPACPISTASSSTIWCRFRQNLARRFCQVAWTMAASRIQ